MRLLAFGFCVLQGSQLETGVECNLRDALYDAALSWFAIPPGWVSCHLLGAAGALIALLPQLVVRQ